jgi:hypothetical protein
MNTIENSVTPWRRFVQAGLILVLGCIATSGIIALHVFAGGIGKGTNDSVGWRSSVDCHIVVGHIVFTDDGISKYEMHSSLRR